MPLALGRVIIGLGLLLVVAGALIALLEKITGVLRLPGDILIKRENFTFYFPVVTCLLVSAILSLFFWLFNRR